MAGFGRREIPHCMTDMQGPDKFQVNHTLDIEIIRIKNVLRYIYIFCFTSFQVCGRENWCEKDHRRKYCKLNFLGVDGEINHVRKNDESNRR